MSAVDIETATVAGWEDCLVLRNGVVEAVATTEIGPRVISFRFVDGADLFSLVDEQRGETGGDEWRVYGGHRLWHAPEDESRTYAPDNEPIEYERTEAGVHLRQPVEASTGIRKELTVELAPDSPHAVVTHELTNEGAWPVELAPWGITVLEGGGRAVIPFEPRGEGLLPERSLSVYPHTSLSDERISFGADHLFLDQQDGRERCKLGAMPSAPWGAYVKDGTALCKTIDIQHDEPYPDRGAPIQSYTDDAILELETTGPLQTVAPGESATHVEEWHLYEDVTAPTDSAAVDAAPYSDPDA